jgi:hypothetical protein
MVELIYARESEGKELEVGDDEWGPPIKETERGEVETWLVCRFRPTWDSLPTKTSMDASRLR